MLVLLILHFAIGSFFAGRFYYLEHDHNSRVESLLMVVGILFVWEIALLVEFLELKGFIK